MKKIIVPLCLLLLFGCIVQSQSFINLSNGLSSCQLKNGIRKSGTDRFNEVRLKLNSLNKLGFVDSASQTFFLETYDLESGMIYGLIWNSRGKLIYNYHHDKFSFDKNLRFSEYMIELVENWDIDAIRKEEELNAHSIPNPSIYATKINRKSSKDVNIECIMFKDFFKLGRD
ncbi:hypothetical protein [Pedobacter glucosidilyticus]|uniref:hypothetical protein n=1 Tax=Pedobacter glucosidilyticus TaxID=1122941 RepID=UPI000426C55F|nr:hypothetical protein [Pedobacter glucosidilyticus]